jgi:hypothetical protein
VANLLNRPTDGATVSVRKDYFPSGCEYVKLPFSLRVPKNLIMYYETSKNKVFEVFCFWISGCFKRQRTKSLRIFGNRPSVLILAALPRRKLAKILLAEIKRKSLHPFTANNHKGAEAICIE